jgi:hypothetical protein
LTQLAFLAIISEYKEIHMGYKITSTDKRPTGWIVVKGTACTYSGAQAACRGKNSPEIYEDQHGQIHFTYFDREDTRVEA